MVQDVTGKKIRIGSVEEDRKADVRIYITDNHDVTRATGWRPVKDMEDILKDTNRWMDRCAEQLEKVFR